MFSPDVSRLIQNEFSSIGDRVFLSASFTTMPPRRVREVMPLYTQRWLETFSNEEWEKWVEREHAAARGAAAALLGCGEHEIALAKNTTEGVGILASGYPWTAGKNIVIPAAEHGADLHSWIPLAKKGVALRPVTPRDPRRGLCADDIVSAMDENTEAVVCSVIQYGDGAFPDIERVGRACRDRGAILAVDAIQAVGRINVNVKKMNIDYLSCGSHKGLLSMDCGGGIIYCREGLYERITPPCVGLESTEKRSDILRDMSVCFKPGARRLEGGSQNTLGAMMMAEACRFLLAVGPENIEEHILGLEEYLFTLLPSREYVRTAGDRLSGVVMGDFRPEDRPRVLEILERRKINATVRPDNVRFCISMVNTPRHMEILADALVEIKKL